MTTLRSTSRRIAELREIAARYPQPRSALLPMLHLVQSVDGYVTPDGHRGCAEILDITAAEVSAVATFYTMYKRRPVGDYHVGVCTNTLCAVMGGDVIFERLKDHLDVGNDETTHRRRREDVTLEHVECNAACDYAPVVMVNWEFFDNQTPESAARPRRRPARPGAATCRPPTAQAARGSRTLARGRARCSPAFPDDRADEGPSGEPARRRWSASSCARRARLPIRPRSRCRRRPARRPARRRTDARHADPGALATTGTQERAWTLAAYEQPGGYAGARARRSAHGAGRHHRAWSRTPACAAAVAPASRPA